MKMHPAIVNNHILRHPPLSPAWLSASWSHLSDFSLVLLPTPQLSLIPVQPKGYPLICRSTLPPLLQTVLWLFTILRRQIQPSPQGMLSLVWSGFFPCLRVILQLAPSVVATLVSSLCCKAYFCWGVGTWCLLPHSPPTFPQASLWGQRFPASPPHSPSPTLSIYLSLFFFITVVTTWHLIPKFVSLYIFSLFH